MIISNHLKATSIAAFLLICLIIPGCSKEKSNSNTGLLALLANNWKGIPQWARTVTGGTNDSIFYSTAAGRDGIYAAGYINGNVDHNFGGQIVAGANAVRNVVLVKYDGKGNAIWAKSVSVGPNASEFKAVTVGSDGIYAAGTIGTGDYTFGDKTVHGISGNNVVLVKYDTAGNAIWAKSVTTGPANSGFLSVAAGRDGIYAAGSIDNNSEYNFGTAASSVTGDGAGVPNVVLVKYDTNGNAIWARSVAAGPSTSIFNSVAAGSDGIYAAGSINGTVPYTFGTKSVTGGSLNSNVLLVKYDTGGNAVWARTAIVAPDYSRYYSVAAGRDGIYAAGVIAYDSTAFNFGNGKTIINNTTHDNAVLVKYDTAGNAQWIGSLTSSPDGSEFDSVAAGSDGIYVAGLAYPGATAYDFGNGAIVTNNTGREGVLLVKYDTAGNASWARSMAAQPDNSYFNSVAVGSNGIYAVGYFFSSGTGLFDFGNDVTATNTNGQTNAFLVKYR